MKYKNLMMLSITFLIASQNVFAIDIHEIAERSRQEENLQERHRILDGYAPLIAKLIMPETQFDDSKYQAYFNEICPSDLKWEELNRILEAGFESPSLEKSIAAVNCVFPRTINLNDAGSFGFRFGSGTDSYVKYFKLYQASNPKEPEVEEPTSTTTTPCEETADKPGYFRWSDWW